MRSKLLMLASVALLSVLAGAGMAQTSGEITGLVTDSSGAAVSGATVTVTNKATSAIRQVTTNNEGLYSFPSLLPGAYELKVYQIDVRYTRTIASLWERVKPQFIFEVNNIFNHPNYTAYDTVVRTNTSGRPVDANNN
jgi:hypothetical protein